MSGAYWDEFDENASRRAREYREPLPDWLSSPGARLLITLDDRELRFDAVAYQLDLDPEEFDDLVSGRMPMNERIADQLEALTGVSSSCWLEWEGAWRSGLSRTQATGDTSGMSMPPPRLPTEPLFLEA